MSSASDLLETALLAADAAADVHAKFEERIADADIVDKGTADFVSHVDLEAQEAALEIIRNRFPGHRILSEEAPPELRPGGDPDAPLWIVDPLDGTTNFLHRHPAFAASVGVLEGGLPVAGAVVAAATGERWWAARGLGAFRNGRPIRVSPVRDLRRSLVGTGFPFKRLTELPSHLAEIEVMLPACSGIRRGGSAALDLCYLAQGSLDAFWETRLDPWDIAGGIVILSEAGGVARRKEGGPLAIDQAGSVVAANSEQLLEDLSQVLLLATGR
jgi:myo-inositol-1(or 4)-monophosphatase